MSRDQGHSDPGRATGAGRFCGTSFPAMKSRVVASELVKQKHPGALEAGDVVAIKVIDGDSRHTVDLHTPVDADATFELVRETDKDGLQVIRHSTAHVMADAVQKLFPGTK